MMIFFASLALSFLFTWAVRWYALRFDVSDVANDRSLHQGKIPRGGGLAIVLVLTSATGVLGGGLWIYPALLMALVGFIDDHRSVAPTWRLAFQVIAAVWAVLVIDGWPTHASAWIGIAVFSVFLIWLTNLYNFMDGINGIAGVQLFSLGAGLYGLGYHSMAFVIMGAALGFLVWNWTPAKIFMGDVGSLFIGFFLGCVLLELSSDSMNEPHPISLRVVVSLLLWVFVCDATVTLMRRALRGERLFQAHRLHAYQHAALRWGHARVSLAILLVNLLVIIPLVVSLDLLMETKVNLALGIAGGFWALGFLLFAGLGSGRVRT